MQSYESNIEKSFVSVPESKLEDEYDMYKFPSKREASALLMQNFSKYQTKIASNLYHFDFSKNIENNFLYAVTVKDHKGSQNPHYGLIGRMSRTPKVRDFLQVHFHDFEISGNSLFGEPKVDSEENIVLYIYFANNQTVLVEDYELEGYPMEHLYEIHLLKKFNLKDYTKANVTHNELEQIKRLLNLNLQRSLQNIGYYKSDPGTKCIYYQKNPEKIMCVDNEGMYFVSGVKINTNFYEHDMLLIKAVQKFRLLRTQTFYDFYVMFQEDYGPNMNCVNESYRLFAKGLQGLTIYSEKKIQIDDVEFDLNPQNCVIKYPDGTESNLLEYYKRKYNIYINDATQPLLVRRELRKKKEGGQEENVIYFVPELVQVMGLLESDRNINFAKYITLPPGEKFKRTNEIMKALKNCQESLKKEGKARFREKDVNFNLIQFQTPVLRDPIIRSATEKITPDDTGKFDIKFKQPFENKPLENWFCYLIDVNENEWTQILKKMNEAGQGLGISYNHPVIHIINNIQHYNRNTLKDYFDESFNSIREQEKKLHEKMNFLVLVTSKKHKWVYPSFKSSVNCSSLGIPSQCFWKETVLEKDLTPLSSIFLQIWAKRDLPPWKLITFDKEFQESTMIVAYSVGYNSRLKKGLTTLTANIERDNIHNVYYPKYHSPVGKYSPIASALLKKALGQYYEVQSKFPSRLVIYREGLNIAQRKLVIEKELSQIYAMIKDRENFKKWGDMKITFIFVNKQCDTKIFSEIATKKEEGVEVYEYGNAINQLNSESITNVPPGTLVYHTIVSNLEWDFYLCSAYSDQGTSTPTHYVVAFDSALIEPALLYKLTYYLTFLYFNNPRCIRMPAPLRNCMKMTNFVTRYLDCDPNKMLLFNNFTL